MKGIEFNKELWYPMQQVLTYVHSTKLEQSFNINDTYIENVMEKLNIYDDETMDFTLKNSLFFTSDLQRMEEWNSLNINLRTLQPLRTPLNNFPSYSYLYHPYNAFSMLPYQNYFDFRRYFRSHLIMAPYTMLDHRYCCYGSNNRCSSIFGKQTILSLGDSCLEQLKPTFLRTLLDRSVYVNSFVGFQFCTSRKKHTLAHITNLDLISILLHIPKTNFSFYLLFLFIWFLFRAVQTAVEN